MATISERKNRDGQLIGWQVKIRKQGHPTQCKTFDKKRDAEAWATVTESEMVRSVFVDRTKSEKTTLRDVVHTYISDVAPGHKGARDEILRLSKFLRDEAKLCQRSMANLQPEHFEDYRDERLKEVSASTVKRELGLLHTVIETARRRLGLIDNPISDVKRPKVDDAREVRLHGDDEAKLLKAIDNFSRTHWIRPCVVLAIETAMRRGELLDLEWQHVDFDALTLHLPDTKTGKARTIPMSPRAYETLWDLGSSERPNDGRVIGTSADGIKNAFDRVRKNAGMEHLNFHDLRHEATSRLFEQGWGIMEVAHVTGHQDIQMLKRYTNLRATDLARKFE